MKNNTTGIAVFCYKRAAKLRQSMQALLKNPECANMEVVFFSDGYKTERDQPGVEATRNYIDSLSGFRKIHRQYRDCNFSTGPNFREGLQYMWRNYESFIVVEDDLIVSPNYLRYMLDALAHYRPHSSVFSISGYAFPLRQDSYKYDTVMHNRFCCYGWASWSDRVSRVIFDHDQLRNLSRNSPNFKSRLNREGRDLSRLLSKQLSGKISTWDIQMQVHVSENAMSVVYPLLSKTYNIGFDAESTNTFGMDYLKTDVDPGTRRQFNFCDINERNSRLQKQLRKPYSLPSLVSRKLVNTMISVKNKVTAGFHF